MSQRYARQHPDGHYYGDLQWSWDGNHNHVYGESNGDTVDFYYDVFIGRAPIASTANAQTLLNKVFGYEKIPGPELHQEHIPALRAIVHQPRLVGQGRLRHDLDIVPGDWTATEVNTPSVVPSPR